MSENTKIEWTTHTFNPWRGCTKVSPGCANCYAEQLSRRNPSFLGVWGDDGTRVIAAESYWRQPYAWNKKAKAAGQRHRVFCLSLGDIFEDRPELAVARRRLGPIIQETTHLDWLLLTKRPENWQKACAEMWWRADPSYPLPENVWVGVSVEDQQRANERIPILLQTPAAVRFLSCEPLLNAVDLCSIQTEYHWPGKREASKLNCLRGFTYSRREPFVLNGILEEKGQVPFLDIHVAGKIQWVIVGGESGGKARKCGVNWIRSIVKQCRTAGVPVFVKQLGTNAVSDDDRDANNSKEQTKYALSTLLLSDAKGGDIEEFPEDLKIRQWPVMQK